MWQVLLTWQQAHYQIFQSEENVLSINNILDGKTPDTLNLRTGAESDEQHQVQNVFCKLFIASFTFSDIFLQTYVIFLLIPIGRDVICDPIEILGLLCLAQLDRLTSSPVPSPDNLLMKQRFREGFTIVQLPCCFTPSLLGKSLWHSQSLVRKIFSSH